MSPVAISLMPAAARPRSLKLLTNAMPCSPAGRNTNTACGFASFTRWIAAEKSGFCNGVRSVSTISPPPALNVFVNCVSESIPGP